MYGCGGTRKLGRAGLVEMNWAAWHHPNQTPAEIEAAVLELRQAHMRWGPRKLKRVLERDQGGRPWPAVSTIGEMVKASRVGGAAAEAAEDSALQEPLAHADGPNRVWCADFKGWFRTRNGERIDPLTISDAYSRYLLRCQGVEKTDTARVQAVFEAAFREYGTAAACDPYDNVPPFCLRWRGRISRRRRGDQASASARRNRSLTSEHNGRHDGCTAR